MATVKLASSSVVQGDKVDLMLRHERCTDYAQLQVEVFDCGVLNPSSKLGIGTTPAKVGESAVTVSIDTRHLAVGVYEVKLVRLHDGDKENPKPNVDLVSGSSYPRVFFEVVATPKEFKSLESIEEEVIRLEKEIEQRFLEPVDVRDDASQPGTLYTTFVFVRDVLIGTPIRLGQLALVPTNDGLGARDLHEFVNQFFDKSTTTGIVFEYGGQLEAQSRRSAPVCVVHFPAIISPSVEMAREYCVDKTNALLLALSLSRDAAGSIFDVVMIDRNTGQSTKFTIPKSYVGNLLTGQLAGESAQSLEAYVEGLSLDSMGVFLVELYKEARRERDPRYQYIRLWQVLELLAQQKGFDPNEPLVDFDGTVMMENGSPRLSKGSIHTVFRLLQEARHGSSDQTWKDVNVWFAFRSAIAHYGAITEFPRLSRATIRDWAQLGIDEISQANGHDRYLDSLRWAVRLLLMQRLAHAAGGSQ